MSGFLFDALHQSLGRVLDLRQAQHALTASNIANADTPGYRARVIPFDRVLDEVFAGVGPEGPDEVAMRRTNPRHVGAADLGPDAVEVEELEPTPWSLDGNSVVPERETMRLKENAMMFEAVSRGLSQRLALLRYAASDGKGAA